MIKIEAREYKQVDQISQILSLFAVITQSIMAGTYTNIRSFYYQYKLIFRS